MPTPAGSALEFVLPEAAAEVAAGYAGVEIAPLSDAAQELIDQQVWSELLSDEASLLQVCVRGLTEVDVDTTLWAILREFEAKGIAGAGGRMRFAVLVQTAVAEGLLKDRATELKAMCRRAVSPVRIAVEPGTMGTGAPARRLMIVSGLPEALHGTLPDISALVQQEAAREAKESAGREAEAAAQRAAVALGESRGAAGAPAARPGRSSAEDGDGLRAWLQNLDNGKGQLLQYHSRLAENFEDVEELALVERGPAGEVPDPQFFKDLGVEREDHRELFRKWFQNHFAKRAKRS